MLLFPDVTIQDFIGPYEVFVRASCFEVLTVSEHTNELQAEGGLILRASYDFETCPPADILFVPGGRGITPLLTHQGYHRFLQRQASHAHYVTSVCTGSLLLAACGLLTGYQATTHWRSLELLKMFGVETVQKRVVIDRTRITGGGITAGIDFGIALTARIGGEDMAKTIQLLLEYDPEPPFGEISPANAEPALIQRARELTQGSFDARLKIIKMITAGQRVS